MSSFIPVSPPVTMTAVLFGKLHHRHRVVDGGVGDVERAFRQAFALRVRARRELKIDLMPRFSNTPLAMPR